MVGAQSQQWNHRRGGSRQKWGVYYWLWLLSWILHYFDRIYTDSGLVRELLCRSTPYNSVTTSAELQGTLLCVLELPSSCSASQQLFYLYSNHKLALSTKKKVICIPLCMLTVFLWMQHNPLETGMWRVWKALIFFTFSFFKSHCKRL